MSSLPDAERDAGEVVRLLTGLAALLRDRDPGPDEDARTLLELALDGSVSATRVLDYLRALQGSGDGVAAAVPPRLGPWRDWVPPRGNLFGETTGSPGVQELPRRQRRYDPGE